MQDYLMPTFPYFYSGSLIYQNPNQMGSCFSKCRPKRKSQEEELNHVQDKLEISEAPISPFPLSTTKPLSSFPLPSPSPSSTSSFSCTNSNTSSSCSLTSSSSCSSSNLGSKDRSFSNEFLRSCVQQNPHIMRVDLIKASPVKSVAAKVHARKLDSPTYKPIVAPVKQSIPRRLAGSTQQKRPRASSPTLARQKCFRKEPEKPNSTNSLPSRTLRSPSPSRRFINGDNYREIPTNTSIENCCKRSVGSKVNGVDWESSFVRKENLIRPASPNYNSSRHRACLRNREACIYGIGPKIDEIAVGKVVSNTDTDMDMDSVPMEDIDNPLIALDCFIFL